jgi:putative transcriptional regulator
MTITHHLDDATLMSCAAGSQREALAAVVSSHLSVCPHCRAQLREFERIGEVLFEALPPVATLKDAPVIALRADEALDIAVDHGAADDGDGDVPRELRALVGAKNLDDVRWRRLGPGVWHYPIPLSEHAEGDLRLLKVAPGLAMPEHGHGGSELTLMLRGSYSDRFGTFRAGDVADLGDDVEHTPVAHPVDGCICLIASDRKAKFKGLVARMVQPLTGL